MHNLDSTAREIMDALLRLDRKGVDALLSGLRVGGQGGPTPEEALVPALERIGLFWEEGRISLSQVYMAGRICERAMEEVLLHGRSPEGLRPRLAIGVLEDHHALGKRMVKSALHAAGYPVLDYGLGRRAAEMVEAARRDRVDVLLISCLMLASAVRVKDVVEGLAQAGSHALVVVGGAPFRLDPQLWQEVGAQAMGRSSSEAVRIVQTLARERSWT